jgi:hypothetical protein
MSIPITIGSTIIDFPSSAESPNWAPALIAFAQAVSEALQSFVGPFDVAPQTFVIDAYNPGSNIDIPGLTFPPSNVRAAFIRFTVHRETSTNEANEAGDILAVYNNTNGNWDFSVVSGAEASIVFNITNIGQVQFTTSTIAGTSHEGFITFAAQALQNP